MAGIGVPLTDCLLLEKEACGPHSPSSDLRGQHGAQHGAQQASLGLCKDRKPEPHLGGVFGTPRMIQATSKRVIKDGKKNLGERINVE